MDWALLAIILSTTVVIIVLAEIGRRMIRRHFADQVDGIRAQRDQLARWQEELREKQDRR